MGRASYQAALGTFLGEQLYSAVAPHLTLESLSGLATRGLRMALVELAGQVSDLDGDIDRGAVQRFGQVVAAQYGGLAGEWVAGPGQGLAGALANRADTNPQLVALVALLAAGAAIASDMDVPQLSSALGITEGLDASVAARVGSLRNLALEEVRARLGYNAGPLRATVEARRGGDGELSSSAGVGVGGQQQRLVVDGVFDGDGLKLYNVRASVLREWAALSGGVSGKPSEKPVIEAAITRRDGSVVHTTQVHWDSGSSVLTLRDRVAIDLGGGGRLSSTLDRQPGGRENIRVEHTQPLGEDFAATAGMQGRGTGGQFESGDVNLGLRYREDPRRSLLDRSNESSGFSAQLGARRGLGSQDHLAGELGVAWSGERTLARGLVGHDSRRDERKLEVLGRHHVDDHWSLVGTAGVTSSDAGSRAQASMHGAYAVTPGTAAIAGARWERDEQGDSTIIPEVGAEVGGVPITIGYDTRNNRIRIGISLNSGFARPRRR